MAIEVGDRVDFLDESGGGRVTRFLGNGMAVVKADWGFEYSYPVERLVKRDESEAIPYGKDPRFHKRIREKEERSIHRRRPPYSKEKLEVDLHIEELHDRPMYLSNSEILRKQVDHCRAKIQKARRDNIPRVILIHGVGEGVLKSAVRDMLDRSFPELLYFDAPMMEYGRGATEVRL
ncbi:MAG: Smr/MutS family protein [Flavobacteriales bacterium]